MSVLLQWYAVVKTPNTTTLLEVANSQPIGYDQSVWCVVSTLTFDFGCGHCLVIRSTVDLCRFCVLSLQREVGGVH